MLLIVRDANEIQQISWFEQSAVLKTNSQLTAVAE